MLLLGKPVAESLRQQQIRRIQQSGLTPRLAIIQAGDNLASTTYIKMKVRYGEGIGARVDHIQVDGSAKTLTAVIKKNNESPQVHGIITQLPFPDPAITEEVVRTIDPKKDVDGLRAGSNFKSATAMAVVKLLEFYNIDFAQPIAMMGAGRLVGAPLIEIFKERGAPVTVIDEHTKDVPAKTRAAEVLISATGVAGLIKPDMVSDGAVIVDVGTSEDAGAIVGDVDPKLLENDTLKITPAKGGVGPVTVAVLFEQLLEAAGI